MDNTLHLVGIAKKARRVEVGEEPVGAAARARQARLIVLARDAADNTCRRAAHFAEAGACPVVQCPYSKEELGGAIAACGLPEGVRGERLSLSDFAALSRELRRAEGSPSAPMG